MCSLNTGMMPEILTGTTAENAVPCNENIIVNALTLPPGVWLIISNVSFGIDRNFPYNHLLNNNNNIISIVRGNMTNGGGTIVSHIFKAIKESNINISIEQYTEETAPVKTNILTAVRIGK